MPNERRGDNRSGSRGASNGRGSKSGGPKGSGPKGRGPKKGGPPRRGSRNDEPRRTDGDDRRRDGGGERRPPGPDLAGPAKWGRIARGGAGRMESPAIGTEAYDDFPAKRPRKPKPDRTDAGPDSSDDASRDDADGQATSMEDVPADEAVDNIDAGNVEVAEKKTPPKRDRDLPGAADLERHAAAAVTRSRGPVARERKPLGGRPQRTEDPSVVLARLVGADRVKSLNRKLNDAGRAFQAERFGDARSLLRPVVKEAPALADGRELMGLTLYRLGKWREAIEQLEAFRELTDSTEQHPVLADCHRALGRVSDVEFLWAELGEASPSGEVVTEGRIVLAGTYADQGDLAKAIRTLQSGWKLPKRPGDHHLRRAYALADLYDRAGKTARARELFKWISGHDPRFADVKTRVKQLS